ncbi:arsenate reductase ArsC [Alteromonas macleodii]|uniref:Low molecular weight phosphotyrosine phosphatase family protein n=1 Tax=Alteromonas macleodii TaxID=28108 RepID=A0AB36FUQ7_ALTMA|nr:arsenate reductase ArsC [Alteromonas macleodii]OES28595.1 low molecular weight phosphotyrosine phosphatase family protein [Alteromonas macleodii]OES28918.1 low molecular weight phosphotyrosine phosphatase family protein [Alteromonas macleodii]OES29183.1 low molecular weight phosphotyrosine phosphatase family protein [Alteromonas macleodii]OES40181.1 low molecular weight phosphotyrosine phosphatase family protein [Alteromonas macleodii]
MKILYICTHNRCRSILCEAITNTSNGNVEARSAGSQPVGEVHPLSLKYLAERGFSTDGLQSQSWDEFEDYDADLVVTVCDSAAGESCPVYFGKSLKVHWGLEDPSKLEGSEQEKAEAFNNTIDIIEKRVAALAELAEKNLDKAALKEALSKLGAQ